MEGSAHDSIVTRDASTAGIVSQASFRYDICRSEFQSSTISLHEMSRRCLSSRLCLQKVASISNGIGSTSLSFAASDIERKHCISPDSFGPGSVRLQRLQGAPHAALENDLHAVGVFEGCSIVIGICGVDVQVTGFVSQSVKQRSETCVRTSDPTMRLACVSGAESQMCCRTKVSSKDSVGIWTAGCPASGTGRNTGSSMSTKAREA